MLGQPALLTGGRGGWVINHSIVLGGGFYSLINDIETRYVDPLNGRTMIMNLNCGGLEFEYIYPSTEYIHASVLMFLGGGGVKYRARDESIPYTSLYGGSFLVWEPQLNAELNLSRFLHIGVGISYRFIRNTNYFELNNEDLSGFTTVLTLKYGNY